MAFGLLLALVLIEVVLRFSLPDAYYVWPPNFRETFRPDPDVVHGIEGASRLTINSFGVRGDPFTEGQKYRLLAIGGSTTICSYLDDTEAWPYLVQKRLNAALGGEATWVGNVGRPGHTTVQHVLQVERLLHQHRELDAVLLLIGINDMLIHLSWRLEAESAPARRLKATSEQALQRAFSVVPGWDAESPWYGRTAIGRWWTIRRLAARGVGDGPKQDERGAFVEQARRYRKQASSIRHELPDLTSALSSYVRNVNTIVDTAQAAGVRVVFLTQPTLWREDLSPEERNLLWTGGPPLDRPRSGAPYYAVEALATGMAIYNESLLGVCRDRGVECIDVARQLPRDATAFFDDAHYTEEGARKLAELVADYLLRSEPLVSFGRGRQAKSGGKRRGPPR